MPSRPYPLLALLALVACAPPPPARVTQPAQHVLLITIDTLRADRLGAFGCPRPNSISIDNLAGRGVAFSRTIAQSSWTAPSMVSLMTSRYLAERRMSIPAEVATLSEHFQAAGFGTAAFVSNPLISTENGFARGFDVYHHANNFRHDPRVGEWIRSRAGLPTFTFIHLTDPHDPYKPPRRLVRKTPVKAPEQTRAVWAQEAERRGWEGTSEAIARIELARTRYEGEVRWTDRQVFKILRELASSDQLESTAIAIAADHGEGLWDHLDTPVYVKLRLEKGAPRDIESAFQQRHGARLYQELIRVPLVISAPSLPRGLVIDALVENVDLAPTLLELAGLTPPKDAQGRSLVGLALGEGSWDKTEAFSMTRFARSIVRADGWKLVEPTKFGRTAGLEVELFDLDRDPAERRNLAESEPELCAELSSRIEAWAATGLAAEDEQAQEIANRNLEAMRKLGYVDSEGEDGY